MSLKKIVFIALGTITTLLLLLLALVALLVYLPPLEERNERRDSLLCPEEQYTAICIIRSYLVPSPARI